MIKIIQKFVLQYFCRLRSNLLTSEFGIQSADEEVIEESSDEDEIMESDEEA